MKYIGLNIIRYGTLLWMLCGVVPGIAQVKIGESVFMEDFGVVPDNWTSLGNEYSNGSSLNTFRVPLNFDGKDRGGTTYTFGARTYERDNCNWGRKRWFDNSMSDLGGGNGKYALALSGTELGKTAPVCFDIKTWCGALDHTANNNGLALLVNSKSSKETSVLENVIDEFTTLNAKKIEKGQVYLFRLFVGNAENGTASLGKPQIHVLVNSGNSSIDKTTSDLEPYSGGIIWLEVKTFIETDATSLQYIIKSVKDTEVGNVFVIDDISLSPVTVEVNRVNVDFCKYPGYVFLEPQVDGEIEEGLKLYSRLMRCLKGSNTWEWDPHTGVVDSLGVKIPDVDYLKYDYRVAVGLGTIALNTVDPNSTEYLNKSGYYSVSDNLVTKDYCLSVSSMTPDYTGVADSIRWTPTLVGAPEGAVVYARWMKQAFDGGSWAWFGEARPEEENRNIDWVIFSTGNFRCVYAFSPELLTALDCNALNEKELYCAISEVLAGANYSMNFEEVFEGGGALLRIDMNGVPLGANVYTRWYQRPRTGGEWNVIPEDRMLSFRVGLVTYSENEYRVATSLSKSVIDTLGNEPVSGSDAYRLSQVLSGRDWSLAEITNDYCTFPGKVNRSLSFTGDYPEGVTATGRWRQRIKGGAWEWMSSLVAANVVAVSFQVPMADYLSHEYEFIMSWSRDSLQSWNAGQLPEDRDYYVLRNVFTDLPFCLKVDTIRVLSEQRDELILHPEVTAVDASGPIYGRWMRIPKGAETGEWITETVSADYDLKMAVSEYGKYDYRFYAALAPEVVETEADHMGTEAPYFHMKSLEGKTVYCPVLEQPEITCIAKKDSNRVTIVCQSNPAIRSLVYRIGNGAITKTDVSGQKEFHFTIDRDSVFCLLSYAQEGICDSIVRNDTVRLTYKPKLQIGNLTDVFGCRNSEAQVTPFVSGIGKENLKVEWYKGGQLLESDKDTLRIKLDGEGAVPLKLAVSAEQRCPEDSTVLLITGEYPEVVGIEQTKAKEVCVGQTFEIGYLNVNANSYRITLKETTMPGFVFYPGEGKIDSIGQEGTLIVKSLQTPLTATDFMVGSEFVFHVQLFKIVNYRGVNYRCENAFDYRFRVRQNPGARYASLLKLCEGENLELAPDVVTNGNRITEYRWRIWDGVELQEQELVKSETDSRLIASVSSLWNNKRLQLTALCECGEVVVQDMKVAVFVADSNRISGPDHMVISGEKVTLEGSSMDLKDGEYRWENSKNGREWEWLKEEKNNSIVFYAPDTTTLYQRKFTGEGWNCPEMTAGPLRVEVFNNTRENTIYIDAKDTLVYSGTSVTIHADASLHEGVEYKWERYTEGVWDEIGGETGKELVCNPGEVSIYRRVAVVNGQRLKSNVVVINVYDPNQNKILYTGGLIRPGESVRVIGNSVSVEGVKYSWWKNTGDGWQKIEEQEGWNMQIPVEQETRIIRYVYLPAMPTDSLASNELTVYTFDNETDNRIHCGNLNVCNGEEINVQGKKIGGDEVNYRWECSYNQGLSWEVKDEYKEQDFVLPADRSMWIRRRVLYPGAEECYSNILQLNVIHNSVENLITQQETIIAGETAVIAGTEVTNASYIWEWSADGEEAWTEIGGAGQSDLYLDSEATTKGGYVRRRLKFGEVTGCEGISNVLKLIVLDREKSNVIGGPSGHVCEWTEFRLTGSDMNELNARYQWYEDRGNGWQPVAQAFQKDLIVYEGTAQNVRYRREATVGELVCESNEVEMTLWTETMINNVLEQPGVICAGQDIVIKGSDALQGEEGLADFVRSYVWEESTTGAGSTWTVVDSVHTQDLLIRNVEEAKWYRRIIKTSCGTDLKSEPIQLDVKEQLRLTLRNDAPFGQMNPKEPIWISVDEDYYASYEFKIDGQMKVSGGQSVSFYGWSPKREYQVVVNVVTPLGCSQTDTMRLRTPDVDLPNVLTPNEDGYNDVLLAGYDLKVYNRWGNLLYFGQEGWDGKYKNRFVSPGTYFYVVKITHTDGSISDYKRSVTVKK